MTHKRVVAVISIWVMSAFLSLLSLTEKFGWLSVNLVTLYAVFASIEISCLRTSASLYYKIYLAVRHHANQIHALQAQREAQNNEMANTARLYILRVSRVLGLLFTRKLYFATIISGLSATVRVLIPYTVL